MTNRRPRARSRNNIDDGLADVVTSIVYDLRWEGARSRPYYKRLRVWDRERYAYYYYYLTRSSGRRLFCREVFPSLSRRWRMAGGAHAQPYGRWRGEVNVISIRSYVCMCVCKCVRGGRFSTFFNIRQSILCILVHTRAFILVLYIIGTTYDAAEFTDRS